MILRRRSRKSTGEGGEGGGGKSKNDGRNFVSAEEKLFDLGKATEKSNGKRIKVYAKIDREQEKDRQQVEIFNGCDILLCARSRDEKKGSRETRRRGTNVANKSGTE